MQKHNVLSEELLQYRGSSPCPDDFDAFWKEALEEVEKQDMEAVFEKAEFQSSAVECLHMWFHGTGDAAIHVKFLKPVQKSEKHPALLRFHGYTSNAGAWADNIAYAANGYYVFVMDCRGQGGLSEDIGRIRGTTVKGHIIRGLDDGPEHLLYRSIFQDTAQLARIVMAMSDVDEKRIGVFGESQGGALSLVCAALVPEVKKAAVLYPFLTDYRKAWELGRTQGPYEELGYYFRRQDPCHEKEEDIFLRLGYIDVQNFVKWIRAEVLFGTGLLDVSCPPLTQFAAYNKINADKTLCVYPEYQHELIPDFEDKRFQFLMGI